MRTRLLAVALATAACSTGTRTIVIHQPPAEASPPRPPAAVPAAPREPLEIIVARPIGRHLHVQTNRAAYVAIFEITPNEGVEIVHPVSARQQRVVTGPARIPLWWNPQDAAPGRVRSAAAEPVVRYIYAIASERPLRLTDAAFVRGDLPRVAGLDGRAARDPYLVMRALSRRFVPPMREEQWAEDVYRLGTTAAEPARIARVYCGDGSVVEIPEEIAARAWCPAPARVTTGTEAPLPTRPDSIKGNNGRHLAVRSRGEPIGRAPGRVTEDRVPDRGNDGLNRAGNSGRGNGVNDNAGGNGVGRGAGSPPGRDQGNGTTGRGNAPGATTTPPRQMRADTIPGDRPNPRSDSAPGARPDLPATGKPDAPRGKQPDAAGLGTPPQSSNRDSVRAAKPDAKPDTNPKAKSEPKAEVGQTGKANSRPDDKPDTSAKPDTTSARKPEGKPKAKPDTTETKPGAKADKPAKPSPQNPPPPAK